MKMRYEVGEYLSLSDALKLYLMKCAAFCDAHFEPKGKLATQWAALKR